MILYRRRTILAVPPTTCGTVDDMKRLLPSLFAALLAAACSSDFAKPGADSARVALDKDQCTPRQEWVYADATEGSEHAVVTEATEISKRCMRRLGYRTPRSYWGWWGEPSGTLPAALASSEPNMTADPAPEARTKPSSPTEPGTGAARTAALAAPHHVQLGAYRSRTEVRRRWRNLRNRHRDLLSGLKLRIERVDLGRRKGGVFYRMQAGQLKSPRSARDLCALLSRRRVRCLPVRS